MEQTIIQRFQRQIIISYVLGSVLAVFGVGSVFIFRTLILSASEIGYLLMIMVLSAIVMISAELVLYKKHTKSIYTVFNKEHPSYQELEQAFITAYRFPKLTFIRIIGPHLFGLGIPATIFTIFFIEMNILSFPYYYIVYAWVGAILIAIMHGFIEFFLCARPSRELGQQINLYAKRIYKRPIFLNGRYFLSIRTKLFLSIIFTATFPVVLMLLALQIRTVAASNNMLDSYWSWSSVILVVILAVSLACSVLLYMSIKEPIERLSSEFTRASEGTFEKMEHTYADEFDDLVSGFNTMVTGINLRDERNEELLDGLFAVFATTLDARDEYTAGHSFRVADYSVKIAETLNMEEEQIDVVRRSALLHDIGKIGISDSILLKTDKLTKEEFDVIKEHPVLGAKMLEDIGLPDELLPILPGVKYHHERYDGRGYPEGLKGEDIPLLGRLLGVADAFDAMTSDRPYVKGKSFDEALAIIDAEKGSQFDPYFADVFIQLMNEEKKLRA